MDEWRYFHIAEQYANDIVSGRIVANIERIQGAQRFLDDLANVQAYDIRPRPAEFVIGIIEKTMKHNQGETLSSMPLMGKPLLLEPWQIFIVVNLLCFYKKGTNERRFKEAFIYIPRKNGKTLFVAGLAWGLALLERASGSSIYIVGAALKQALQSFNDITFSLREIGELDNFRVLDNNSEHSITRSFTDDNGKTVASIRIEALAANPDKHDSLNSNIQICDELHAYKNAKQYNVIREAGKAYTNKLCIGITTAGDNMTSFCYQRLKVCRDILARAKRDEALFIFICKADEDKKGEVDIMDRIQHQKANPNYGVSIRQDDIARDALDASNDPQQKKDFLAKSLNVYTASLKSYFNIFEFQHSDKASELTLGIDPAWEYKRKLEYLAKLPVEWYGGADMSKLHDLTASSLNGEYKGVDILITHGFFPIVMAHLKADEDNIPLFGWKDDGVLTMSNTPTVLADDVVKWFKAMRAMGFKIKEIGHDRKFCREYYIGMKKAGFKVVDQPQLYIKKNEGFRHIEKQAKNDLLYYLHSDAYEYCVQNVRAIEKSDDMIQYEKVEPEQRIDYFDASVFSVVRRLEHLERAGEVNTFFGNK